jgi:hypothetical protein
MERLVHLEARKKGPKFDSGFRTICLGDTFCRILKPVMKLIGLRWPELTAKRIFPLFQR